MRKFIMMLKRFIAPGLFLLPVQVMFAQDNFDNFIEAGSADATAIYRSYGAPLLSGLSYGFSRGWYQTAKAHKPLGFDFSIQVAIAYVPDKDLFYDASAITSIWNSNGGNTRFAGNETQYPTIVGPEDPTPVIEVRNPITNNFEVTGVFDGPTGLGFTNDILPSAIPVAMPQFGIGLIKNTDLKFRFLPSVGTSDVKLGFFGVGIMHDIKQWIPGNSIIPLDISVLVAYSNVRFKVLNIDGIEGNDTRFGQSSWNYNLLVSKKLSFVTFYGGFVFLTSSNKLDVVGVYDTEASITDEIDPISTKLTNSGAGGTLGFRLKFAVITINGEYTFQKYNTLNFGIGVTFR